MIRSSLSLLALPLLLVACDPVSNDGPSGHEANVASLAQHSNSDNDSRDRRTSDRAAERRNDRADQAKRERRPDRTKRDRHADRGDRRGGHDEPASGPARYAVKMETTKGDFIIDVTRSWAPRGADRFYELVSAEYYDNCAFFRVIKGFMAQTGISGDPALNTQWRTKRILDDPPEQSNTRGMVTFAMGGPNSRTTQFFVSFRDNSRLNKMGFSPIGRVRDMEVVDSLYSGYGEGAPRGRGPSQGRVQAEGNPYLKADFPNLDYIVKARVISR